MTHNPNPAELTIPLWWRLLMSGALLVAGIVVVTLGLGLGDWFINHSQDTETTVVCDDDYFFDEDETNVEFLDDGCVRTTEETTRTFVHDWPIMAAAPVFIVFGLLMIVLVGGGALGSLMLIVMCWDKDMDDTFKDRFQRRLRRKNR